MMGEVDVDGKSKILIIIIVILLCMCCFVGGVYVGKYIVNKDNTKVENNNNTENNNTDNKTPITDTNNSNNLSNDEIYDYTKDTKLKEMYELYVPSNWFGPIGAILTIKEEVIKDTDLSDNVKNHLGYVYRIYENKEREESCKNYLDLDEDYYSACFEGNLDDKTFVFDEVDLELAVKELFGNYTASTFNLGADRFKYDFSSKKYVHQSIAAGGTAPGAANKIASVTKNGNNIEMILLIASKKYLDDDVKDIDYDYEYKFTFEVSDSNYIFKSLEKTLRK